MARVLLVLAAVALLACGRDEPAVSQAPPVHVDSIFPVAEEVRRFKAARNDATAQELKNASESRDVLVARFMKALAAHDTTDLRAMAIDAAEFIDLYYPTSVYAQPPYRQSPEVTWLLLRQDSEKGIRRALERYGGERAGLAGYQCGDAVRQEGANSFWQGCTVEITSARRPLRLFASIVRRNGRFKFVSYANDL